MKKPLTSSVCVRCGKPCESKHEEMFSMCKECDKYIHLLNPLQTDLFKELGV